MSSSTTQSNSTSTAASSGTATTIVVNASASLAAGVGADFTLLVDGQKVGSATAGTAENAYTFQTNLTAGEAHDIQVEYTNDTVIDGQDRNLFLQSISVNGTTVPATSSYEVYDPIAGVNQADKPGDGNMYWDGTANFTLPASFFPASSTTTPPATSTSDPPSAFYVSTSGSASGTGTQANPFATLAQAQSAMENSTVKTTVIEGGTYSMSSPLALTSKDNGETFEAASGATVALDGGNSQTTLVSMNGASNVTLSGLTFQNTAAGSASVPPGAVQLTDTTGVSLTANHFLNNADDSVLMMGANSTNISGNEFDNVGQSAVEDKNDNGGTYSNANAIENNLVNGAGSPIGAIYLHGTTNDVVDNNQVENTQGAGISLQAIGGYTASPTVYARNTGTVISGNSLSSTDQSASDNGAIYVIDRTEQDTGIQITNNEINGASSSVSGAHIEGIYLDDYTSGVTVSGNILRGVESNDVQFHGGKDDSVTNNIFDLSAYNGGSGTQAAVLYQAAPSNITPNGGALAATNDTVSSNIYLSNQSNPQATAFINYSTAPDIQKNLYYDLTSPFTNTSNSSPQTGNPDFTSASANNYTLGTGSAASLIGFQAINQANMGLHPTGAHWYSL